MFLTRFTYVCARPFAWLMFRLLYRLRVVRSSSTELSGGFVVVANHTSFLDPPVIQMGFRRMLFHTPRATLSKSRIYRWLTALMPTVPIDRGGSDMSGSRRIVRLLQEGNPIALFPEQTRSKDGRIGPLKGGFHLLASRAGVPVIPAVISGAYESWPRQRKLPRLGPQLIVRIGQPIDVSEQTRGEAISELQQRWRELGASIDEPAPDSPALTPGGAAPSS